MRNFFRWINNIIYALLNIFLSSHIIFIFFQYSFNDVFFFCSFIQILFVWVKVIKFFKMKRNVVESRIETRLIFLATIISIFSAVVRIRFMILLLLTIVHFKTWSSSSIIVFRRRKIAVIASLTSKTNAYYHRQICDFMPCITMLT